MKRIAIEEHFQTQGYLRALRSRTDYPRVQVSRDRQHNEIELIWCSPDYYLPRRREISDRLLLDLINIRLQEMDEAGIDMQILSLVYPGPEVFDAPTGAALARETNNELSQVIKRYPERLAGFAAIALQNPPGAADELERAVTQLGLKGAKINSHVSGEYLDDKKYWVLFERAEKLGVPIYIHPREPSPDMLKPYLAYPALSGSMWGYAAETGLHAMRLICSGLFDQYPNLKVMLGHLGEALPFWLWRMDERWKMGEGASDPLIKKLMKRPSQYVKDNFLLTTSGMFWEPAFLCVYLALGADNILFAVDYPFEPSKEATEFMDALSICDRDKEKVYHLNAEALLGL
jgi:5-carboxyvanillate decarboxylase